MIRRCTATFLLVTSLALTGCGGAIIPPSDEVTTRMNAKDEEALDKVSPRPDAGATRPAPAPSPQPSG